MACQPAGGDAPGEVATIDSESTISTAGSRRSSEPRPLIGEGRPSAFPGNWAFAGHPADFQRRHRPSPDMSAGLRSSRPPSLVGVAKVHMAAHPQPHRSAGLRLSLPRSLLSAAPRFGLGSVPIPP